MRNLILAAIALFTATPTSAQTAPAPAAPRAAPVPVAIEYYYRIKWGSSVEFKRLYNRNHAPLLAAMQRAGFVNSIRVDEPVTHMAGGPRWDLRVTIVFRDADAAISDPQWEVQWAAARARLYPDKKAFDAEEDRRFSLLEEHWDVVVAEVKPE